MNVSVAVGTIKGAFVLRSDEKRAKWKVEGPFFKGWKVTAFSRAPGRGYLAATASFVYGPAVHRSDDLASWTQFESAPRYSEASGFKLNEIWKLATDGKRVFAGVDEAGLFRSDDGGATFALVDGLTSPQHRAKWFPGAGGLCCHSVLVDANQPERIVVGISAVGAFRSDDGGKTFASINEGVEAIVPDPDHPEIGYCVHALTQDPADPGRIWRQDHKGMYRTRNGGDRWEKIENGLPSGFGFPLAHDPRTGAIFCAPLESDEYRLPRGGRLEVYRSKDGGESWQSASKGLPSDFHHLVLRGAMATDGLGPCGVYFGTTGGTLHVSADGGDSWQTIPHVVPRVLTVAAFVD